MKREYKVMGYARNEIDLDVERLVKAGSPAEALRKARVSRKYDRVVCIQEGGFWVVVSGSLMMGPGPKRNRALAESK